MLAITMLILGACGSAGGSNTLDATNADTLVKSINSLTENMGEKERQTFGEDVIVIYRSIPDEDKMVATYLSDYEDAFNNFELARNIALKHKSLVHGKNPRQLATQASKLRQDSTMKLLELKTAAVRGRFDFANKMVACIDQLTAAAQARGETAAVGAWSQVPTDPLHLRNLGVSRELCSGYQASFSGRFDTLDMTLVAARKHDYSERFDPSTLTELEQAIPATNPGYRHCGNYQLAQTCSISLPTD